MTLVLTWFIISVNSLLIEFIVLMFASILLQHRSIVHLQDFICVMPIFLIIFCLFQVGVVVYGYRPKIWFLLNRHGRSDTLLQEIQSTPFDESPGNNIGPYLFLPPFW